MGLEQESFWEMVKVPFNKSDSFVRFDGINIHLFKFIISPGVSEPVMAL